MNERADMLKALSLSPSLLHGFVTSLPESVLDRRRGSGFWTIKEHLAHLADVQPMLLGRLQRFAEDPAPEFTPLLPGDDEGKSLPVDQPIDTLLERFREVREEQLELIEQFSDAVWKREALHPEFTHYTATILIRHIYMHDHWHMYRMEELWITRDEFLTELK